MHVKITSIVRLDAWEASMVRFLLERKNLGKHSSVYTRSMENGKRQLFWNTRNVFITWFSVEVTVGKYELSSREKWGAVMEVSQVKD